MDDSRHLLYNSWHQNSDCIIGEKETDRVYKCVLAQRWEPRVLNECAGTYIYV